MLIASSLLLSLSWTSKDVLLFLVHCIMLLSNPAKSGKAKTLLTLPVATALIEHENVAVIISNITW